MSVTCDRSVFFSWFSGFLHQYNWPSQYNWNIVKSSIKHHQTNKQTLLWFVRWNPNHSTMYSIQYKILNSKILKWTSLGPTCVFQIDRCLVYAGYLINISYNLNFGLYRIFWVYSGFDLYRIFLVYSGFGLYRIFWVYSGFGLYRICWVYSGFGLYRSHCTPKMSLKMRSKVKHP